MESLKQIYISLLEDLKVKRNQYPEKKIVLFFSEVGKYYANQLLFVGRATNGWYNEITKSSLESFEKYIRFTKKSFCFGNMEWIYNHLNNKKSKYNPNRSAFWRTIRSIANKYNKNDLGNDIFRTIAWTDVYKIAGHEKNPSSKLIKLQSHYAKEIFTKEIELISPKIIIFLTSIGWASPFLPSDCIILNINKRKYIEKIIYDKKNKRIYIVVPHPQGKQENIIVNDVIVSIQKINEMIEKKEI